MLWVRDATADEREKFRGAALVGLHIDLGQLMALALGPFIDTDIDTDNSFVLAISDLVGSALVERPPAQQSPRNPGRRSVWVGPGPARGRPAAGESWAAT